uniref:Uncharacterized protein n=1 Tax=Arundo donax TaxID=35708 RepID=A0A0A9EWH7_ARUDO
MKRTAVLTSSLSAAVNNLDVVRGEPPHPLGFITMGKYPFFSASSTNILMLLSMLPSGVSGTKSTVESSPCSLSKSKLSGQSSAITPPSSKATQILW